MGQLPCPFPLFVDGLVYLVLLLLEVAEGFLMLPLPLGTFPLAIVLYGGYLRLPAGVGSLTLYLCQLLLVLPLVLDSLSVILRNLPS